MHERPHDPCRGDSRSGTSYGEPTSQRRGPESPLVSVGPNRLVTPLLSSAMVFVSTTIAYPHPRHTRRSASQRVRPALRRGSELTGAFPADVEPAQPGERVCAGHPCRSGAVSSLGDLEFGLSSLAAHTSI